MPIAPGTRIGNYEIQSPLGEGGMGAVYKAHDPTLQRTVAIKVLAKQDEDASARLLQEARAASALNHPHICTIHEVGEHEGQAFIVMEHVEGKPLSALIPSDGLPPESVIRYGTQIADALAHAHERGVVHRDLKSANVVITPEGRAKVLDFGLAKRMPRADADAVTRTQETLTQPGMLVGTLAYMAPEVLRGEAATARSDIWALGVVLYEMASGRPPFSGTTQTDLVSSIMKEEPALLPNKVSPSLRNVIQHCLTKEAAQRYPHPSAIQAGLDTIQSDTAATKERGPWVQPAAQPVAVRPWLRVGLLTATGLALAVAIWNGLAFRPSAPMAVLRLVIPLPSGQQLLEVERSYPLALSPNSELLVYVAQGRGERQLFLRALDDFETRPIDGSEGARYPFFSPDSQWIGFFANGQLRRVAVAGGRPLTVCDAVPGPGATWASDGYIYFSQDARPGLYRVLADGGTPEAIVTGDAGVDRQAHRWPHALPDGRGVVSTLSGAFEARTPAAAGSGRARLAVWSVETNEWRVLQEGSQAQYLDGGYLVYHAPNGELQVAPFALDRTEIIGPAAAALDDVFRGQAGWRR